MAREFQPLIRRLLLFLILPACALVSATWAGGRVNILLASRPDRLILYNQYQQRLTSVEAGALPPYEPMIVEDENALLGDGFTRCIAVRIRGTAHYLLRDADGGLPSGVSVQRDVEMLVDTIRILPRHDVVLESPDRSSRRSLTGGTVLVRLFRFHGTFFVREAGERAPLSGWIQEQGANDPAWEILRHAAIARASMSTAGIRSVVDEELEGINRMLHSLFARQGSRRGDLDTIPFLRVEEFPDSLVCRLLPANAAPAYRGGLAALAGDLARRLENRGAACVMTSTGVTVRVPGGPR